MRSAAGSHLADPRTTHAIVLEAIDDFGNVLQSAAVAYGRRHDDPDPLMQRRPTARRAARVTHTVSGYTNAIVGDDVPTGGRRRASRGPSRSP